MVAKTESGAQPACPTDIDIKQAGKTGTTAFELSSSTFFPITYLETRLQKTYISMAAKFKAKSIQMLLQ